MAEIAVGKKADKDIEKQKNKEGDGMGGGELASNRNQIYIYSYTFLRLGHNFSTCRRECKGEPASPNLVRERPDL